VGGTVRNLAAAAQRLRDLPDAGGVQGVRIPADTLDELIARLAALPAADRSRIAGIKPSREDLILAGAAVIRATMTAGGFPELEATEAGLREGVFFERHLRGLGDPPLLPDVREASVLNLAALYEVDEPHTDHVAALALGLFDELAAAGLHPGDPHERELLWAACMLHDIGMSVDYDDHHKHSRYLILNAGLPGYAPREVALIAQAARFHRKGMPEAGFLAGLIRGKADLAMLDRMSACLRLAEDLERSRDQLVRAAHVRVFDGTAELALEADDDAAVPRWAAGREIDLFRRAFGRELVV
jgi:exopolyphosphatase/guanosine-5'-triphosphate,3'-diphosphate pyrophosphatase